QVDARISELEKALTINSLGGEVNLINEKAGVDFVKVSDFTFDIVKEAIKYGDLSKGNFDITIGPLVKEWGVYTDHPQIPSKQRIEELMKLIDYRTIKLDNENKAIKLANKNQTIDLGGIGKGFAGDEAKKIYIQNNISSAFVNLGGNVVLIGTKPDGSLWNVGVQNPSAINGKYIGTLHLRDKAIVSSGDYERYFEKDGVRYHHILDPKTGYPSQSGLMGTTIIAERSIDADGLSTSTFVLGLEEGMKLVESLPGVEAIFITTDKKIYTTSGLKDSFTFTDESGEYQYVQNIQNR
ncbi:MAG: FAD:protein FMN transferase, partial [Vallitaleaceae bacterium]|nr:FAD:protein FMN transferase [Vallitaleaceae bacterium]